MVGDSVKRFLEILTNIRIGSAEVAGTAGLLLLLTFGIRAAWNDFIAPLLK
jgi:hypothetical protein